MPHPPASSAAFARLAPLDRRAFLRRSSLALGAALLAPGAPWPVRAQRPRPVAPVRVRGQVRAGGKGLARVAVTDGLHVVQTDADGAYELVTDSAQRFVYLTLPAGYDIPTNTPGTANFYRPIAGPGEMEAVFDLQAGAADEDHAFFVLADTQMQNQVEVDRYLAESVPDVRATAGALGDRPMFGVACGDIMFDNLEFYPGYEEGVQAMGVPFFQVVGNHDLVFDARSDIGSTAVFEDHFGPRYYSFDRGAVHYVVLDDVLWHGSGYIGYLDEAQIAWLEQDLARVEAGRPVVVFVHIPALSGRYRRVGESSPGDSVSITNRAAFYEMLAPYRAHIISGHTHEKEHVFEGGAHEHVVGAVCGAWWSGDICYDGTPNGYDVWEVSGESMQWRYKATGAGDDHQIRVYQAGSDPHAPDEFVANVWDWDPEWTVAWYEDGVRTGAMARRTGLDPMAARLHTGPELPERRPWVEPQPTDHLFYAPFNPEAREIRVEATDRFGRTYTAVLEPEAVPAGSGR